MPLSAQGVDNVKAVLDGATKEGVKGVSGLVFVAVDKAGNTLVEHASGTRSIDTDQPMDMDTSFWIASMTKIVTTIAVLQLVEAGKIPLDDADFIARITPEIAAKKVYADGVNGVEQEKRVTMRMLLAHTAGFAYDFLDPRVSMIKPPAGTTDEFAGDVNDLLENPLVNQPGTMWEYSVSIDWAGLIVERITSQKLDDYFHEHIFKPLGVTSTTMFPTAEMKSNLAGMHQRDPSTGEISVRTHIFRRTLEQTKEEQDKFFQSGGAGLWSKPTEYVKILLALLNDGESPTTGQRILSAETVKTMWENQIPEHPNFARGAPPPAYPAFANQTPDIYPQEGNPPQGWGLSMFLTIAPGGTGRGANTGWWAGLANCFWWVDREKGVAGVIAGQVIPFIDPIVVPTWAKAEKAVYDGLGLN